MIPTERLDTRIHARDIRELVAACADDGVKEQLFALLASSSERAVYNILWVFTHLPAAERRWLWPRRDILADMLLTATHIGQRRLLLTLLNAIPIDASDLRTDLLDHCLAHINTTEPYAIRALSLKQAWAQCRFYPELIEELRLHIEIMSASDLPPGLRSARRSVLRAIEAQSRPSSR